MRQEKEQTELHKERVYKCIECGQKRCGKRNEICGKCEDNLEEAIRIAREEVGLPNEITPECNQW